MLGHASRKAFPLRNFDENRLLTSEAMRAGQKQVLYTALSFVYNGVRAMGHMSRIYTFFQEDQRMASNFICNTTNTVVSTNAGQIRGFCHNGIFKFYGIKYADAARFHRPTPVKPWEGIRDALGYGYVSPMLHDPIPGTGELRCPHRYWPTDENCQYLNVWTPSLEESGKKPVMVWLHGGGFSDGSSIEQVAYDGTSLASFGDVVVVTLNHRLNILGFLDLSPFGEEYANSANAGLEDIVYALKWVKENIAGFGGDPENVTIFGQSGGGGKVSALMQIPSADGLFQKGIIQSGIIDGIGRGTPKGLGLGYLYAMDSRPIVTALMEKLGLTQAKELETVPYAALAAAYNEVAPAMAAQGIYVGNSPMPNDFFVGDPLIYGFTDHAKTIPVIVGSVINEFKGFAPSSNEAVEKDGRGVIAKVYGEKNADTMISLFRKAFPGKSLRDLADMDDLFRRPSIQYLELRAKTCAAPSYSYMLTMDFDIDGGNGAWHCSDIPFVFHNADLTPFAGLEGGKELEDRMSRAWLGFARTGDPNHSGIPAWPACQPGDEACMLFDRECQVGHNHDHALMKAYKACMENGAAGVDLGSVKIEH